MSLEKGYFRILLVVLIFATSFSAYRTFNLYRLYKQRQDITYDSAASTLEITFKDIMSYTDNSMNVMGKKISHLRNPSPRNIALILQDAKVLNEDGTTLFTWTLFDFVSRYGNVIASSSDGILSGNKKVSSEQREWILEAPKEPWKGHFSFVDQGLISGEKILPYGYGITNNKGKFLGTISMGISIKKLNYKLQSVLGRTDIKFMIFRTNGNKNYLDLVSDNLGGRIFISDKITKDIYSLAHNNQNKIDLLIRDVNFSNLYKLSNMPFIMLVGRNKNLSSNEFKSYILPRIEQSSILIIFLIITCFIIKKKVINPISSLSGIAREISGGKTKVEIDHYDCYEVEELAKQIRKIKKYINIERQKEEAEQKNLNKSSFLASVSHDLRNPIAAIHSMGDILSDEEQYEALSKEERNYFLNEISNQASESLEFINDLLDVSQSEVGNFKLGKLKNENIEDLINRSVRMVKGRADKSKIEIIIDIDKKLPQLKCDQRRIKQILVNLLVNSIKYSDPKTSITVSAQMFDEGRGVVRIAVKDQGFGMAAADIEKALKKYGTIKNRNTDKVDSLGLGLSLVKYLIEQHNGVFVINSELGKGSEFIMDFVA